MASRRATHDTLWRRIALTPTILVFLAMSILPTLNLMAMSVNEISWVDGKAVWSYVGFTHYARLAEDSLLIAGLKNTAIFAIAGVAAQVLLGFLLAWAVSRIARGRVLYRTIFILPILVPGILIGAVWKLMLNYDFGLVNGFIGVFGIHPVDWLGTRAWALPSVIMVDIWHWTPFCFLLLLAGFESLPQDVQEAARVDGAGTWAEMRYVLIPMMMPVIAVTFLFRLVTSLKVFDEIYLLTGGGPGSATEVISYTIYRTFFTQDRMGYGSAMSVTVLFFISLAMIGVLMAGKRGRNAA
ncbi:MAG: sugar ABC transporter permease [Proteobacteria bacterium]|nr:sugar ABC transporter permease [Pseudomonadota bacterium]